MLLLFTQAYNFVIHSTNSGRFGLIYTVIFQKNNSKQVKRLDP